MNAPPLTDSVMIAMNFGFTVQNVESQDDFETLWVEIKWTNIKQTIKLQ